MRPGWEFTADKAQQLIAGQFALSHLTALGDNPPRNALIAAGALLAYLQTTQKQALPHLTTLTVEHPNDYVHLDAATQKHLELFENRQGGQDHCLLAVLDHTATTMGSRLLKRWLGRPLKQQDLIEKRHQAVHELINQQQDYELHQLLRQSSDVERILTRISLKSARPRDLIALRTTLALIPTLANLLANNHTTLMQELKQQLKPIPALQELLDAALVDNPPMLIRDGGVIAAGFDDELDELNHLSNHAEEKLSQFERDEKQKTVYPVLSLALIMYKDFTLSYPRHKLKKPPFITIANKH